MEGTWKRALSMGVLAGTLAFGLGLGGCANKQAEAEAATESNELRTKNAQLEQSLRERDATIAELQKNQSQPQMQVAPATDMAGGGANRGGGASDFSDPNIRRDSMAEGERLTVTGDVLFGSGSADLKPGAKKTLDKVAAELKSSKYTRFSVRVDGYTDSDPIKRSKWGTNEALSEARARSVEKYLVSKGVSSSRLSAVGRGASTSKKSKADNRRVEIIILTH